MTPAGGAVVAKALLLVIVASTMLVHQHYIADVALGLAVAALSSWLFLRLTRA
ncbi:MAG TPA: hypothetical protein VNY76_03720 [Candidatus Acidoferrales bacterium]|jgi:membrane-associated phospholipid phosphatase|nr:hypothetical protein [Candidatus Acidoferrales bacterium]